MSKATDELKCSIVEALQRRGVVKLPVIHNCQNTKIVIAVSWRAAEGEETHDGRWVCNNTETGEFLGLDANPYIVRHKFAPDSLSTESEYYHNNHLVLYREYGMAPWGVPFAGQWVVRDIRNGELIDNSMYVNDLIDKYNFPTENKE